MCIRDSYLTLPSGLPYSLGNRHGEEQPGLPIDLGTGCCEHIRLGSARNLPGREQGSALRIGLVAPRRLQCASHLR
eukprot:1446316-Pyramimonas_sp.AAC.1